MKGRNKLLFVTTLYAEEPNATYAAIHSLLKNIKLFQITAIVASDCGIEHVKFIQLPYLKYDFGSYYERIFRLFREFRDLIEIIKKERPNIICVHGVMNKIIIRLILSTTRYRVPVIEKKEGSYYMESIGSDKANILKVKLLAFFEKMSLGNFGKIVVPSYELKSFFINKYGFSPSNFLIIPNHFDDSSFYPLPKDKIHRYRKKLGFEGKKVVMLVAPQPSMPNIPATKMSYKVINHLRKVLSNSLLVIVGGGDIVGVPPPEVVHTGFVKDLNLYLNCADILILPYPKNAVCGGNRTKLLQYMRVKKPIVSTKEGVRGVSELKSGVHFALSECDPKEFAEKIVNILHSDQKALEMAENAFQVSKKYSIKKISRMYEELFINIASSNVRQNSKHKFN